MKWEWKNCPMAWRGVFKSGKDAYPTIGLEAVVDWRLWFWHSFFGFPGTQNDINVLDQSNLFENMVNGVAPAVHFVVNMYEMGDYLTDGIYLTWSVLMQSIGFRNGHKEQLFEKLQEAKCKEIERAYTKVGCQVILVLHLSYFASFCFLLIYNQARWCIVTTPCRLWNWMMSYMLVSYCTTWL